MDPLEEKIRQLSITNGSRFLSKNGKVAALVNSLQNSTSISTEVGDSVHGIQRKVGPDVPPKPLKKSIDFPQVPQSRLVAEAREPLYSCPLQADGLVSESTKPSGSVLLRKHPIYDTQKGVFSKTVKSTLDNPAVLEQQLEALAYHKQQMEKKGLLGQQQPTMQQALSNYNNIPKLSSTSLGYNTERPNVLDTNLPPVNKANVISKDDDKQLYSYEAHRNPTSGSKVYSNLSFQNDSSELPNQGSSKNLPKLLTISTNNFTEQSVIQDEDELPPPPSPVSSSYSELRRATDVFPKSTEVHHGNIGSINNKQSLIQLPPDNSGYEQKNFANEFITYSPTTQSLQSQGSSDYYGYGGLSQNSSTYDSIYEPINPRPPSEMSTRSNYLVYAPYVNSSQMVGRVTGVNLSIVGNMNASGMSTPTYSSSSAGNILAGQSSSNFQKEDEVEALTDLLVHSMDPGSDIENYGICSKCNERVLGENTGCTAMEQIYHIACFTCWQCQINLQGKPFYALDGKPYCEFDYLQTLEKCSVCMKPILERILRATGKPYHPQCFTCVVCGNSLDGVPFTVDATNQNYCITDFHKKFAPRCCVCKEPIMPEPGQEETIRVVALDRSFHLECYKCEDCNLLLSSEAEGRGCYPLDDHVLCKSCNARRVQLLTNRMTTEL